MSTGPLPPGQFAKPGPPPEKFSRRVPTLLSGLALIVALVAAGVSLVALSRTGDVPQINAAPSQPGPFGGPATTDATPTDVPPTDATVTTDPTGAPTSGATDAPDPHGVYRPVYQQKVLRLQPSSSRYIDVDKPSADASGDQGEFQYSDQYVPPRMQFGALPVAKLTSSNGAGDCVSQLDTAPIDGLFTPAKGDLICVLTDGNKAVNQGITRKVALLRVDAIAPDGTLNLTVTAWNVPS